MSGMPEEGAARGGASAAKAKEEAAGKGTAEVTEDARGVAPGGAGDEAEKQRSKATERDATGTQMLHTVQMQVLQQVGSRAQAARTVEDGIEASRGQQDREGNENALPQDEYSGPETVKEEGSHLGELKIGQNGQQTRGGARSASRGDLEVAAWGTRRWEFGGNNRNARPGRSERGRESTTTV